MEARTVLVKLRRIEVRRNHRRSCVGPVGGELIHEIVVAMAKRMTVARTRGDAVLPSHARGNLDVSSERTGGEHLMRTYGLRRRFEVRPVFQTRIPAKPA